MFTLQTCHVEEDEFLVTDTNGTEIFMSKGDMPQRIGDEHEPGELLHKWRKLGAAANKVDILDTNNDILMS